MIEVLEPIAEHKRPFVVVFDDGHHEDADHQSLAEVIAKPGASCYVVKDYYAMRSVTVGDAQG